MLQWISIVVDYFFGNAWYMPAESCLCPSEKWQLTSSSFYGIYQCGHIMCVVPILSLSYVVVLCVPNTPFWLFDNLDFKLVLARSKVCFIFLCYERFCIQKRTPFHMSHYFYYVHTCIQKQYPDMFLLLTTLTTTILKEKTICRARDACGSNAWGRHPLLALHVPLVGDLPMPLRPRCHISE